MDLMVSVLLWGCLAKGYSGNKGYQLTYGNVLLLLVVALQPASCSGVGDDISGVGDDHGIFQGSSSSVGAAGDNLRNIQRTGSSLPPTQSEIENRKRQQSYNNELERWIEKGYVTIETVKQGNNQLREKYVFQRSTKILKDVFKLLQNYLNIFPDKNHRYFSVPFGKGSTMEFRLRKGLFKAEIWFLTMDGKMPKYEPCLKTLSKSPKESAKFMLDALNAPLENQPEIPSSFQQRQINAMEVFLTGSHIAEAAHPQRNKPKSGRTRGSDHRTREILEEIKSGASAANFDENTFVWVPKKGAMKDREDKLKYPDKYDGSDPEKSDSDSEKRAKLPRTEETLEYKKLLATLQNRKEEESKYIKEEVEETLHSASSSCRQTRKKRSPCFSHENEIEIVKDSITVKENKVEFEVIERGKYKNPIKLQVEIDPESLIHERTIKRMSNEDTSPHLHEGEKSLKAYKTLSRSLGVYALVAGIAATGREFSEGHYGRGSLFLSQSLHSVGSLTGLNEITSAIGKRLAAKGLSSIVVKLGLEQTFEKMTGKFLKSAAGRFLGAVPYVGIAMDTAFVGLDIKDLAETNFSDTQELVFVPLKVIHLDLDVASTALNVVGAAVPPLEVVIEPIVLAITIARMAIDDFYIDIVSEMNKVNWRSPSAPVQFIGHLFLGVAQGAGDFLTGGMIRDIKAINEEVDQNKKLIHQLKNVQNYYSIHGTTEDGVEIIDFTGGPVSVYGGRIVFYLFDNGTASLCIKTSCRVFDVPTNLRDIVLGVGESRDFKYKTKTAKLWWIIPTKSASVICGETLDESSMFGTYHGNSKNNRFMALQDIALEQQRESGGSECAYGRLDVALAIKQYRYNLYGNEGKDTFYLGPQHSYVEGGNGNDMYLVHAGASTVINNFARDGKRDFVKVNSNFEDILCERNDIDLVVTTRNGQHLTVKYWFTSAKSNYNKHLLFRSEDSVVFFPTSDSVHDNATWDSVKHNIECNVVFLETTDASSGQTIDLRRRPFDTVIRVVGSKFNDTIHGNEKDNVLDGNQGNDLLIGYGGHDTYIVHSHRGPEARYVTINNYATDNATDTVMIHYGFRVILLVESGTSLVLRCGLDKNITYVILKDWYLHSNNQHAVFVTDDHVTFQCKLYPHSGKQYILPLILDYSEMGNAVAIDLSRWGNYMHGAQSVISVFDSAFSDTIIGNDRDNFLSCSGGEDTLSGGRGADKYVFKESCQSLSIDNFDSHNTTDVLYWNASVFSEINVWAYFGDHLVMFQGSKLSRSSKNVYLHDWFTSPTFQHLIVQTTDGVIATLPSERSEKCKTFRYQVSEDCKAFLSPIEYIKEPYPCSCQGGSAETRTYIIPDSLIRIDFQESCCRNIIIGNSKSNYINPGPNPPTASEPQYLEGNNGSDLYDIKKYNNKNDVVINNDAWDGKMDTLTLGYHFREIKIRASSSDVIISDTIRGHLKVTLSNYTIGEQYQHLLIQTLDGYTFDIDPSSLEPRIIEVDHSSSQHSTHIMLQSSASFSRTVSVYGAAHQENIIDASNANDKVIGGDQNDIVNGEDGHDLLMTGMGNDTIYGMDGNDTIHAGDDNDDIYAGDGDDVIVPGYGADYVDGGWGCDTVIYSGDAYNKQGVFINLTRGIGRFADAEDDFFYSVENVWGSEFNDVLVGDRFNNELKGFGGDDVLIPMNGDDFMTGGPGQDIYSLTGSTGFKVIDNFAADLEIDYLFLNDTSYEDVTFESSNNGLDMYVTVTEQSERKLVLKLVDFDANYSQRHMSMIFKEFVMDWLTTKDTLKTILKRLP